MAAHFTGEENMEKIMPVKRLGYYEGNGKLYCTYFLIICTTSSSHKT
jgi:hypothetical protein